MASEKELSDFLKSIELKAFKRSAYATRDDEAALDIVQDSMMRLAQKYGDHPAQEFPMLFNRILHNATMDWFRRQKTQNNWLSFFSAFQSQDPEDGHDSSDPLEFIDVNHEFSFLHNAEKLLERKETLKIIENEIEKLPTRQREAFLMRYWDGLDIAETAKIMGCSEGSVKTHCSRAASALAYALKKQGLNRE